MDTDQIIPARYLNTSDPYELAQHVMEDSEHPNYVVLIKGEPKLVGIKTLLQEFMAHRLEVILRRSKFFLSRDVSLWSFISKTAFA